MPSRLVLDTGLGIVSVQRTPITRTDLTRLLRQSRRLLDRVAHSPHLCKQQARVIDLRRLPGVAEPGVTAPYTFETGLTHTSTGSGCTEGFADVWLKGHFTWENKALGKSLDGALKPLMS